MQILNIRDFNDVLAAQTAILKNEEFELGEIKPLKFKIKIDGGRFTNYDIDYVDAKVAKIILSYQSNYNKLLDELEKKFGIKFTNEDKILKFKLGRGSLELLSELLNLKEVLKTMDSKDLMYTILTIAGMWFSYLGYTKYLEKEAKKIEIEKEIKEKELDGEEKVKYVEIINNTLETFKEIMLDKKLQDAINTPKKEVLSILEENEKIIDNNIEYTSSSSSQFEYIKPNIEDTEEIIDEKIVTLDSYIFTHEGKPFKIQGLAPLANSSVLDASKRMKLISKAESQQQVKLKLKVIKDGITKRAKEVYILDFIE